MCEPVSLTIAAVGIAAASATAAHEAQRKAASRAADTYRKVGAISLDNYKRTVARTGDKVGEAAAQVGDQQQKQNIANLKAKAGLAVSAGEGGVQGTSVNDLFTEFDRIHGTNTMNLNTNFENFRTQEQNELLGYEAQTKSSIASSSPTPAPSFLGPALQIAGTAVSAADSYNYRQSVINRPVGAS